jgi:hypothetical protein
LNFNLIGDARDLESTSDCPLPRLDFGTVAGGETPGCIELLLLIFLWTYDQRDLRSPSAARRSLSMVLAFFHSVLNSKSSRVDRLDLADTTKDKMSSSIEAPPSVVTAITKIENSIMQRPEILEIAMTELNSLLNKYDPAVKDKKTTYPLVPAGFNADDVQKQIRDVSGMDNLKVTDIRFRADQLAKAKRLPLPKATMNHKEPLLQWFKIHWNDVVDDIRHWKDQAASDGSS